MAEFCYECIQRVFPEVDPRKNDLAHGFEGEVAWDLCEGCGEGWFDWQGRRVAVEDEPPIDDLTGNHQNADMGY